MDGLPTHPADSAVPLTPAPQEPQDRLPFANRRSFRLGLGFGVIILAGLVLVPRLVSYTAEDAIVQGRAALLHTPIEGTVVDVAVQPGQAISGGTSIVHIANSRVDRSFLNELLTERNFLQRRVANLSQQALELLDLRQQLTERTAAVSEGAVRLLEMEITALEAEVTAIRARLTASESELARQSKLSKSGHTSVRSVEIARADRNSLAARIAEMRARIELLREEQAQAKNGIFVSDGRYGAPYSEIRKHEISITLLDIYSRRGQEENRIEQIERQIDTEEVRLGRMTEAQIEVPFDGVVWKVLAQAGTEVVIGTEVAQVLDCTSPFLEILVSESRFERITIGEEIRYRFVGTDRFRTGRVTALRGGNVHTEDRSLLAQLTSSHDRGFRVWAELDAAVVGGSSEAFCNVGRHVDVRFNQSLDILSAPRGLWSAL